MRLFVFFDLPTTTAEDKQHYIAFRRFLLQDGYMMLQYSVYSRIANGLDGVQKHERRIKDNLPPHGNVRFMVVTEKQYAQMQFLVGYPSHQEKMVTAEQNLVV